MHWFRSRDCSRSSMGRTGLCARSRMHNLRPGPVLVHIAKNDCLACVAARRDVVERVWVLNAKRAGHDPRLRTDRTLVLSHYYVYPGSPRHTVTNHNSDSALYFILSVWTKTSYGDYHTEITNQKS